ncbi:nucleotidyltransferase domain-containing protein [Pseudonocardia sp. CA-107938]|uniref:nucleotidyltransferase domain-containing protein n=1 Tax=Pseudonocardia sp. CA-107938 TaxID=3240021 RepID=UPI003D89F519
MDDDAFLDHVTARLAALPHVETVTLGGSRAQGTHGPGSDWDLAVYYRGPFDPQDLRDVGWPGEVSPIGGWGGGIYNGGAWLEIDGRRTDVHYRDLAVVDREIAEARAGRVHIEHLLFHLAGVPTYLLLAEVAVNRVLHGSLPAVEYPDALRAAARRAWWDRATLTFDYAATAHAAHGRLAQVAGLVAQATTQAGHAVLAARGEWITNEKALLARAGLRGVDGIVAGLSPEPDTLRAAVDAARSLCRSVHDH